MPRFISPTGNPEVWKTRPHGYLTPEEWQARRPAPPVPPSPTTAELLASLRAARDSRLAATDYLAMGDYPLDDAARNALLVYRQALRDLPQQTGAPWDGGGEATPWPKMPERSRGCRML